MICRPLAAKWLPANAGLGDSSVGRTWARTVGTEGKEREKRKGRRREWRQQK